MAVHVTHTAKGWQVGGEDGSVYASLREALDAARVGVSSESKVPFLRDPDTNEANGAWRWLPASEEEAAPICGVRIDAVAIEEMAASLNNRTTPIPIDGGPAPDGMQASAVHGTASDSGTPANGWAHWGIAVKGADGIVELYLWAELVPSVAREIDAGRIAMGSVHFGCARVDDEKPRGCVLISHALTNNPAVTTLAPGNSVRMWRSRTIAGRVLRAFATTDSGARPMAKKITIRAKLAESVNATLKNESKRGPALAKLTEIALALGVAIDDEMSNDSWESPTVAAISALKQMAAAEKVLEGLPASESEVAAARAAEEAKEQEPKADEAKRSTAVALALGLAEDASEEDILAAIAKLTGKDKPADGEVAAARTATSALRTEVSALRSLVAELEPLRAEKAVRDRESAVDGAMAVRGMKSVEQRKSFLALAEKYGVDAALASIDAAHVPPGNTIVKPVDPSTRTATVPEGAPVGDVTDASEATRQATVLIRAEQPGLTGPAFHTAVLARARKDFPRAFSRAAQAKN